jgi:hypothetical protein
MKNRILILSVAIAAVFAGSCEECQICSMELETVKKELAQYPDQRLVDVYKTFFQGVFGPAHLVVDANEANKYLSEELATSSVFEEYDFQPLPPNGKFVRANLKLIKQGKVSQKDFVEAFVRSAKPVSKNDIKKWRKLWPEILMAIKYQKPDMPEYAKDKAYIEWVLAKGEYVVHHSREFEVLYNPHYRVMLSEEAEKLKNK